MENLDVSIIHPIFVKVKHIKYESIKEVMIFKNMNNMYIKHYTDPLDYEEQFDTLNQKLEGNETIFEYIQYFESIYSELIKCLDESVIIDIVNHYINYDFTKDKYPKVSGIFDISSSNEDFHMRILIKIFAFPTYSKLKQAERMIDGFTSI